MSVKERKGNNRKQALIDATLECIANEGLQKTTVRNVAEYAKVTNGLIRFYFSGKDELLRAAYSSLLALMYVATDDSVAGPCDSAKQRLANFIQATLSPPIVSPRTVLLWANFLPMTYIDAEMAAIRTHEYAKTTQRLEPLIRAALIVEQITLSDAQCTVLAIKLNALIDGLWLEGSMASYKFDEQALVTMGLDGAGAILGIDLPMPNALKPD